MSEPEPVIITGTWDELQAEMRKWEDIANKAVLPRQRDIVYGSHWIRAWGNMLVYGRVLVQEAAERNQTRESVRAMRDAYARGYRFSRAYSALDLRGELGDAHLSTLWPITEEEFDWAQRHNFNQTGEPWEYDMLLRCQREVAEQMAAHPDSLPPQEES